MGAVHDREARRAETLADSTFTRVRELFLLLLLASVQFTSIVDFMVVMPLGPQLMRTLEITPAQFGWIVSSSYTIAAGLAGLLASSIMDRFGRKQAFLTLYAGSGRVMLLCGLARGYYALLSARAITGMFGGILGGMASDPRRRLPGRRGGGRHRGLDVGLRRCRNARSSSLRR